MQTIAEESIDMNLENLKARVVINTDTVDIVDVDGNVLASYGKSALFYGTNALVEVYSNGFSIRDGEDNVYFDVHKTSADDAVSERLPVTIAAYDREKTATLGADFININGVELLGNRTGASGIVIAEDLNNDGIFRDEDGDIMAYWSVSDKIVTISTFNIDTKYKTAFNRGTYRITGVRFFGNCPPKTAMIFNGVEYDYPIEQGNVNGWHYKKMASGELECWQIIQNEFKIATSQASEYVSPNITVDDYPVQFASHPCVSVHCQSPSSDHGFARVVNYPVTSPRTNIGVLRLNRQNSMSTNTEYIISLFVKGRWK